MKFLLFANTDWYLFNFRQSLARALRDGGHDVLLVSPAGPYGERLRALGYRWEPAPMIRRSLNPLRELRLLLWLKGLVAREQVDLVHGFTIKCAVYGSLAARLAGAPARVAAVAGLGYVFTNEGAKARVLRPFVSALMRLALGGRNARVILQNRDDADLFARANLVDPRRLCLIPGSGVDCPRFTPAHEPTRSARGSATPRSSSPSTGTPTSRNRYADRTWQAAKTKHASPAQANRFRGLRTSTSKLPIAATASDEPSASDITRKP